MPSELERIVAPTPDSRAMLQLLKRGALAGLLLAFLSVTVLFKFDFRFLSGFHKLDVPDSDIPCTLQRSPKNFDEWSASFHGDGDSGFESQTRPSDFVKAIYASNLSRTSLDETQSGLRIEVDGPSFVVCTSGRVKAATVLLARGRFQQALLAN
jgi:hypothetical protein